MSSQVKKRDERSKRGTFACAVLASNNTTCSRVTVKSRKSRRESGTVTTPKAPTGISCISLACVPLPLPHLASACSSAFHARCASLRTGTHRIRKRCTPVVAPSPDRTRMRTRGASARACAAWAISTASWEARPVRHRRLSLRRCHLSCVRPCRHDGGAPVRCDG